MTDELHPDELRVLLDATARLPREIEPPPGAWREIRERIEARRVRSLPGAAALRTRPRWIAPAFAAAAVLVLAAVALLTRTSKGKTRITDVATQAQAPAIVPATPAAATGLESVIAQYDQASRELEAALAAREQMFAPETRVVIRRSLASIDSAIVDLRAALAHERGSAALGAYLTATYQQKLDFLKRAQSLPARGT